MKDEDHSSTNNCRSSNELGLIENLIQEYDGFLRLISLKFLTDTRYFVSAKTATTVLLFDCSLIWEVFIQLAQIFLSMYNYHDFSCLYCHKFHFFLIYYLFLNGLVVVCLPLYVLKPISFPFSVQVLACIYPPACRNILLLQISMITTFICYYILNPLSFINLI